MIHRSLEEAEEAFRTYSTLARERVAAFLERIAQELEAAGSDIVVQANKETALSEERLRGELRRTVGQLRLFAAVVIEGSWVEARIDTALPERRPLPRPDLRRMLVPLGPVAVFGASNFPLAFSVAGGYTASALAAGCPVVFKAHPAHPRTSEIAARAISSAAEATDMPRGVFSMLHGASPDVGLCLVRHPKTQAVAFTGSLTAGRSLFDAATRRPSPIPVYAEMGSVNPVFVLPGACASRGRAIARAIADSFTLGVGQFCTKPGLLFGARGAAFSSFLEALLGFVAEIPPGTMLTPPICDRFWDGIAAFSRIPGVRLLGRGAGAPERKRCEAGPFVFATDLSTWMETRRLSEELFGPAILIIECGGVPDFVRAAWALEGQLTATLHFEPGELPEAQPLADILMGRVGRLIFGGVPTGVEVTHAMQHGGPYPATTDSRTTSVGTAAITRFARPVCWQDAPSSLLPPALQDHNPLGIWRLVNGEWTRAPI